MNYYFTNLYITTHLLICSCTSSFDACSTWPIPQFSMWVFFRRLCYFLYTPKKGHVSSWETWIDTDFAHEFGMIPLLKPPHLQQITNCSSTSAAGGLPRCAAASPVGQMVHDRVNRNKVWRSKHIIIWRFGGTNMNSKLCILKVVTKKNGGTHNTS